MIFRVLPVFKCRQDFRGGKPCHLRARNTKTWTQHKKVKLINQSEIKQKSITTTKKSVGLLSLVLSCISEPSRNKQKTPQKQTKLNYNP